MRPLLPLTLAFAVGIFLGRYCAVPERLLIACFAVSLLPLVLPAVFVKPFSFVKNNHFLKPHYLAIIPFFILGLLSITPLASKAPDGFTAYLSDNEAVTLRIEGIVRGVEKIAVRENSLRLRLHVEAIRAGRGAMDRLGGNTLLMLTYDGAPLRVLRNERVKFQARISRPGNFGTPGAFDYEWWLKRKGVAATGRIIPGSYELTEDGSGLFYRVDRLRQDYSNFVDSMGVNGAGLLKALTIGDRSSIPEKTSSEFVETGVAHLIAISGLNIGFVAAVSYFIVLFLLKRSEKVLLEHNARAIAAVAAFFPAMAYTLVSGLAVSAQRAVLMVGAGVAVVALGRLKDIHNAVALTALLLLVLNPGFLWDVSFQLSFAAVTAIVLFVSPYNWRQEDGEKDDPDDLPLWAWKVKFKVKTLFMISVVAALGTLPILACVFNRVSLVSVASNMAIVPIAGGVATPLSLFSIMVYPLSASLSGLFAHLAGMALEASTWVNGFFALIPYASIRVPEPSFVEVVAFYAVLLCIPYARTKKRIVALIASIAAFIALDAYYWKAADAKAGGGLDVTFLSVGQGDSALIEFPAGSDGKRKTMLIDGGGRFDPSFDAGEDIVARYLWKRRIRKVDYIVLSHTQRDHMGGLRFLSKNFRPKEFWWSGSGQLDEDIVKAVEQGNGTVAVKGEGSKSIEINGTKIEFLWPPQGVELADNDASLVIRVCGNNECFLFTGDITEGSEKRLAQKDIKASILKVAHHGSFSSSSEPFLRAVAARYAVISVGRNNPFDFPDETVEARLKAAGAIVLRTDKLGAVRFESGPGGEVLPRGLTGKAP